MDATTAAERRFLFAKSHAQRLFAAACAADAEASRLNPWVPEEYRKLDAQGCMDQAARHLDRAYECETEATENVDEAA